MSEREAKPVMRGILTALSSLHLKWIAHRDLKPQNLIFTWPNSNENQSVKLIDFGFSIKRPLGNLLYLSCGSPGYVAPEVLSSDIWTGRGYTESCDVFSAGVIFFLLITFQSLFYSNDVDEVTMLNQACVIEFDIPQLETVSDECLTLLKSMLAKDPQERISTEDALIHPWFSSSWEWFGQEQKAIFL